MSRLPKVTDPHRRLYPSDLSDREWEIIKPLLPAPKRFGRPRTVDLREIMRCCFLCATQRMPMGQRVRAVRRLRRLEGFALALPHDLTHHGTVYKYFQKWERMGIWKNIHDNLRHQLREKLGRREKSTVAIADSQSVETTEKSAPPASQRFPQRKDGASRGMFTVMTVARK